MCCKTRTARYWTGRTLPPDSANTFEEKEIIFLHEITKLFKGIVVLLTLWTGWLEKKLAVIKSVMGGRLTNKRTRNNQVHCDLCNSQ